MIIINLLKINIIFYIIKLYKITGNYIIDNNNIDKKLKYLYKKISI